MRIRVQSNTDNISSGEWDSTPKAYMRAYPPPVTLMRFGRNSEKLREEYAELQYAVRKYLWEIANSNRRATTTFCEIRNKF